MAARKMKTYIYRMSTQSSLVLLVALPLATVSGQARPPVSLQDFYRMVDVSSPAISPDGRNVAVVRTVTEEARNRHRSEVWLFSVGPPSLGIRLSDTLSTASAPSWSPDGQLLAFRSQRIDGPSAKSRAESGIWFIGLDHPKQPFRITGVEGPPIWSPDNRWIAFIRAAPPTTRPTPELTAFERTLRDRFTGRSYESVHYRADGGGYLADPTDPAATPPRELYVVPRSGGMPRQLSRIGVNVEDAAWSPDAKALVFTANTHQRDEYTYERADLWTIALDGETRRLTDDGYHYETPRWSPDGQSIVFRRQKGLSLIIEAKESQGPAIDLLVMSSSGGSMRNLTADWDLVPDDPHWSADGALLYFSAEVGGDQHLFRVSTTGGNVEQVTQGSARLSGFSFSKSFDRMAYIQNGPTHPADAYSSRVDGTGSVKLTGWSDGWVLEHEIAPVERVTYKSKDGTPIEGWVMMPRGYKPNGGPYPLILAMHGGPHGAYGNDFSLTFQLFAAQGYAVLYTNPRGSTGYGERFLWATWGGWGNLDMEDVLAGVDNVVETYRIDRNRLGVTGYSYGGFLTDWLITHDHRFAAAISGAGISNWVSDYGTADIPRTKESEFFGAPWEARGAANLLRQSPIMYAKGVTTPTLFVHGESDFRVPAEQAEQMYTALRKQRVPARMVRYPNESHGGWSPWDTVHRYHEELLWWGKYLSRSIP